MLYNSSEIRLDSSILSICLPEGPRPKTLRGPLHIQGPISTICRAVSGVPLASPRSWSFVISILTVTVRCAIGALRWPSCITHQHCTALGVSKATVQWLEFLKRIDREIPLNQHIHIILDNYATHKHPAVKRWLARHPRFELHFTPTGSSWMNLVERFSET